MNNENAQMSINRTKIYFFMRESLKAHIDKFDGKFLNGYFLSKADDEEDVFIFRDDVLGEQHIFLQEIKRIDNFRAPKDRPKYNNF